MEEPGDDGVTLHPFMLIFPNKRRVYYLKSKCKAIIVSFWIAEKDRWMNAIKKAIGYANVFDFYELKESLG
jgi:hypothetical protein